MEWAHLSCHLWLQGEIWHCSLMARSDSHIYLSRLVNTIMQRLANFTAFSKLSVLQVSFLTTNPFEGYTSNSILKLTYVAQTQLSVYGKLLRYWCWVSPGLLPQKHFNLFIWLQFGFSFLNLDTTFGNAYNEALTWGVNLTPQLSHERMNPFLLPSERILRGQLAQLVRAEEICSLC